MGNELIPSHPHIPQKISCIRENSVYNKRSNLWTCAPGFLYWHWRIWLLPYYQWSSPEEYRWINHMAKLWIVNITTAKPWEQGTRNACIFPGTYMKLKSLSDISWGILCKQCKAMSLSATEKYMFFLYTEGSRPTIIARYDWDNHRTHQLSRDCHAPKFMPP